MKEPGYDKKKARQDQEVLPDASAQTDEPSPKGYRVPRGDADGESTATTFDIRQIIGLCLTYWWLILLLAIMGTAGGVAYCFLARPSYQAMCRYEIFSEHMLAVGEASTMERQTRQLGRQMMLIQSDSLRNRVANKLAPEWEAKVQELKPEVNIRRNGTVLYVYAETDNEEYAVAFLKELIAQYEEMRRMEEMTANESALRRLRLEKMRLENEWQDSKQRLVAFRERHQLRQIAQQYEYDQKFIDKLLQRQQSLRTERAMIGIQLRALKDADAPTVQDVLALSLEAHGATSGQGTGGGGSQPLTTAADTNTAAGEEGQTASTSEGESEQTAVPRFSGLGQTSHWEQMEFAISQLQALYDKRLDTYKPEHPVMVKLRTNIHQAKESIKFQSELARRRLQARYNALKIQQEALSDVTQGWAGPQQDLTIAEASEYRDLQQEVERLGKLVSSIAHRIIDVSAQSGESLITRMVAEPAGIGQVWPKPMIVVPASFAGAFGVGVGLAFLLFFFDSKFTDIMAIEQKLGLPFIGGIPRWQRVLHDYDPEETIIMDKDEPNAVSEAYRSLRISLDGYLEDKKGYALLVTSADPGEGKSATVANLGVAFSWSERRVLLVDADLRRPNLHNVLGQKNSDHGLTQILMGEVADWRESLRHTDYENVDFIPAGKFVYEASELCSRERLGSLLDSWGQEYDIVILDSAPIGRIVDTAMVAKSCDGALLMALHGKASFPAMRHALRRLEGTNVLGFCLNAIEMPRGHGHYYRGYSGYMRYGMYSYYQYYSQALYGYGYDYYGPDESDEEGTEEEDEHGNGESLEGVKDE